jgi:hypothetical protein
MGSAGICLACQLFCLRPKLQSNDERISNQSIEMKIDIGIGDDIQLEVSSAGGLVPLEASTESERLRSGSVC